MHQTDTISEAQRQEGLALPNPWLNYIASQLQLLVGGLVGSLELGEMAIETLHSWF